MDYIRWRNDIFGHPPGSNPVTAGILPDSDSLSAEETLDNIDRALGDKEIHEIFVKEQIGVGLQLIYSNACSNIPLCYVEPGDERRRLTAIRNLRNLYSNFFQRYCMAPVSSIGSVDRDAPRAAQILRDWLRKPTTKNQAIRDRQPVAALCRHLATSNE